MKVMEAFDLTIRTTMEIERRTTIIGQRIDGEMAEHHTDKGDVAIDRSSIDPTSDSIVSSAEMHLKSLTEQLSRIMANLSVIEHGVGIDTGAVDPRRSSPLGRRLRLSDLSEHEQRLAAEAAAGVATTLGRSFNQGQD